MKSPLLEQFDKIIASGYNLKPMTVAVPPGQVVGYRDEPPNWVGVVRSGLLEGFELEPDLNPAHTTAYYAGDLIFEEALYPRMTPRPHGIQSISKVIITALPADEVLKFARQNIRFANDLLQLMSQALHDAQMRYVMKSWPVVRQFAWAILHIIDNEEQDGQIVPYSQNRLANALGTNEVYLKNAIKRLKEGGIVEVLRGDEGPGLRIIDRAAMEAISQNEVPAREGNKPLSLF